jgi:hypothetical protein
MIPDATVELPTENVPMIRLRGVGGGFDAECIFEKREPIPDQDDRDTNVIESIDSRYWLQRYGESSRRQGGPKPITQRGQYALQWVNTTNPCNSWRGIVERPHSDGVD